MPTATLPRRYGSIADGAELLGVTERTVRNFIARGQLTGYRLGAKTIRIDMREVESLLKPIPTAAAGGRR